MGLGSFGFRDIGSGVLCILIVIGFRAQVRSYLGFQFRPFGSMF